MADQNFSPDDHRVTVLATCVLAWPPSHLYNKYGSSLLPPLFRFHKVTFYDLTCHCKFSILTMSLLFHKMLQRPNSLITRITEVSLLVHNGSDFSYGTASP
ncbi:hypothetical protein GDO81_023229 [Engystomops pustulosus]|uniref:Uncharacterized protein n=1 Tax=Engystomops pustulosus TaxID=76066 RepID=A0AAV6Z4W5_ENGPU|nr:hypothetical protein GDO81_023229 [Engystomops pustulosus]